MTSETESIAQSDIYTTFFSLIECKLQPRIDFRIVGKVVNGRRHDLVFDRHDVDCPVYQTITQASR